MLEASPSFIRSRRVGAVNLSMLSSLVRVHPVNRAVLFLPVYNASLAGAPYPPPPGLSTRKTLPGSLLQYQSATCSSRTRNAHPTVAIAGVVEK
jgi:hypothetical protein